MLFPVFFAWLTWMARDHTFFWDTIQFAGKHGLWFYEQNFRHLLLPAEIDSGHPPVFGWYLALVWSLFGKSLPVSHWAMLPFLAGISWQLYRLGRQFLQRIAPFFLVLVVLCDPVFLGQSILASPDIVLTFCFLWAVNSVLSGQSWAKNLAYLGLAAISIRGMMIVAAFGLLECWRLWPDLRRQAWKEWFRLALPFLPAALFSLTFLAVHYMQSGWIGYHQESPWAPSFERVGLMGFLKNLVVLAWRWLDFGRLAVWLVAGYLIFRCGRTLLALLKGRSGPGSLLRLLGILVVLLSISFLSYRGLQAHRYLLPAFLTFTILTVILADQIESGKTRKLLLSLLAIGLLTGNLWVYPDRIAQGWDATLGHWPYYSLRGKMLEYLTEEGIPLEAVGTVYPEIGPLKYRDLSGRMTGCKEKDLQHDRYIWYSNIMNDFSDEEIRELQQNWIEQKRIQKRGVKMILYRKKG